jgi:PPK2 family polyphosphate:nucleotide phosphotransferase
MHYPSLIAKPGAKFSFADHDPKFTGEFQDKVAALAKLQTDVARLGKYQDVLYAQNTYALLLIFQAMDAAGKDSTIKHVMSGVNPQGCQVYSFKAPSEEELDHDYLWRSFRALPERGRIGIFNRSYYEETLVVRVHPELLARQQLPGRFGVVANNEKRDQQDKNGKKDRIWQQRFEEINHFEKYLVDNGVIILKFFLNVSKAEQKKRFLARIEQPEKNWKFSEADVRERQHWDDYMNAYAEVFRHTSTDYAPWHIVPADRKWFTRLAVADVICRKLKDLDLQYPQMSEHQMQHLRVAKEMLEKED